MLRYLITCIGKWQTLISCDLMVYCFDSLLPSTKISPFKIQDPAENFMRRPVTFKNNGSETDWWAKVKEDWPSHVLNLGELGS